MMNQLGTIRNASILVTGGTGFFGRGFIRRALELGAARVCVFSRDEFKQATMREALNDDPRLRWFIGDVRDKERLTLAMEGVDVVVHAAALKRIEVGAYNPSEMVKTNVLGAMNVIDAAKASEVGKVVALSTDKAFQPVSPYGHSKALAEGLFLAANNQYGAHGPRFAVVRYGNVSGSTGSVIPRWRDQLARGETIRITDPECTRFFMWAEEAIQLVVETIETMVGGELNIPTLPAYRLGDLAEAMGAKATVVGLPDYEKLHESMSEGKCSCDARRMSIDELKDALRRI